MHASSGPKQSGQTKGSEPGPSIRRATGGLAVGALGVVYGDIGTSPLYALRESFAGQRSVPVTSDNIIGVLSLITWSLIIVITLKYLAFVMRADEDGEGGILVLTGLLPRTGRLSRARATPGADPHGCVRNGVVVRRWHDHPRHFGAVSG